MITPQQARELVQAGAFEFENFARLFVRIKDKQMSLKPFTFNRVQRHFYQHMTGRDLVLKARQHGMSTLIQDYFEYIAMLYSANVTTYADIGKNVVKLRDIGNRMYHQWPKEYLEIRPPRGKNNIGEVTYPLTDSKIEIATAGSKTSGRAGTISHLHLSEFAFYEDPGSIMAAAMQALTPDGIVVIESTPNGAQGLFYEMCMDALGGKSKWTLHFYPWWWADEYALPLELDERLIYSEEEMELIEKAKRNGFDLSPEQVKWRRNKLSEPKSLKFKQEYPEDVDSCFLRSGKGVFGDIRENIIDPYLTEPQEGHYYVAGIDWGQSDDYTALSIIDFHTLEEVYINRWRQMDWYVIIDRLVEACQRWGVRLMAPEQNSMTMNIAVLNSKFKEAGMDVTIAPFMTTNDSKAALVSLFYHALHQRGLKLLRSDPNHDYGTMEINSFVQKQTAIGNYVYDHADGAKSDTVIARMLAYHTGQKFQHFIPALSQQD
jgi:hypothetical protein